jgi:hypothetical protein
MRGEILPLMGTRYYQLRTDDGRREPELYTSLDRAAEVLVRDNRPAAHVVELDTPGGAVVREFTRQDCEEIVRSASSDRA